MVPKKISDDRSPFGGGMSDYEALTAGLVMFVVGLVASMALVELGMVIFSG